MDAKGRRCMSRKQKGQRPAAKGLWLESEKSEAGGASASGGSGLWPQSL